MKANFTERSYGIAKEIKLRNLGRWILILGLLTAFYWLAGCSPAAPATPASPTGQANPTSGVPEDIITAAQAFVDQLAQGEFAAAAERFDPTMSTAAPPDKLEEIWGQLLDQVGAYQMQLGTSTDEVQGYRRVHVTTQFEQAVIDVLVVFDDQGRIAGLFFEPGQAPGATPQSYNPPGYANRDSFHEVEVTIGSGEWALPGTLTIPDGAGPFPAVVLVHGSGPHDRDETIGPNQPFRDLAWGLASRGIAVLRYDKRTLVHAGKFTPQVQARMTVQEETVEDALLAAELLRETEGIDPGRVFVAGHSLGAMLAPRIGQQDPSLAGLVLLAGPARPLEDLVVDQVTYIQNLDGLVTDQEKTEMETIQGQVGRVKDPDLSETAPASEMLLGTPAFYWLDLRDYQPAEVARDLSMPLLVLQGGRDYQVSAEKDFELWKTALEGKENAAFRLFPELNHLFIAGEGPSTPEEYQAEGHVAEEVIAEIASWIEEQ